MKLIVSSVLALSLISISAVATPALASGSNQTTCSNKGVNVNVGDGINVDVNSGRSSGVDVRVGDGINVNVGGEQDCHDSNSTNTTTQDKCDNSWISVILSNINVSLFGDDCKKKETNKPADSKPTPTPTAAATPTPTKEQTYPTPTKEQDEPTPTPTLVVEDEGEPTPTPTPEVLGEVDQLPSTGPGVAVITAIGGIGAALIGKKYWTLK